MSTSKHYVIGGIMESSEPLKYRVVNDRYAPVGDFSCTFAEFEAMCLEMGWRMPRTRELVDGVIQTLEPKRPLGMLPDDDSYYEPTTWEITLVPWVEDDRS